MHSLYIQVCCGNNCMLFLLTIIVEDRQMHGLPHHILPACHAWSAALFRRLVGPSEYHPPRAPSSPALHPPR